MTRMMVDDTPMVHGRRVGGLVGTLEAIEHGVAQALGEVSRSVDDDRAAPAARDAAQTWSQACASYVEQASHIRDRGMLAQNNYAAAENHARQSMVIPW